MQSHTQNPFLSSQTYPVPRIQMEVTTLGKARLLNYCFFSMSKSVLTPDQLNAQMLLVLVPHFNFCP